MSIAPKIFEQIFRQNWKNARHIKSERIWLLKAECEKRSVLLNVLVSKAGGVAANSQVWGTGRPKSHAGQLAPHHCGSRFCKLT
jgi:hypothetical protein